MIELIQAGQGTFEFQDRVFAPLHHADQPAAEPRPVLLSLTTIGDKNIMLLISLWLRPGFRVLERALDHREKQALFWSVAHGLLKKVASFLA